jgi:NADH dehydrogenase
VLSHTAARSGRPVIFGRGENPINFVSVTDVAALVDRVLADPATRGRVLEISGPDNITFNQLAAAIQAAAGRSSSPRHISPAVLRIMAGAIGRLKPGLGRQAHAALLMDSIDLTRDADDCRQAYPGLPCTPLSACLAAWPAMQVGRVPVT